MVTEIEYKKAKKCVRMSKILLVVSVCLLIWIICDMLFKDEGERTISLVQSIVNTALFTVLLTRNRKIVKEYEN